jgi:hypothetical protein
MATTLRVPMSTLQRSKRLGGWGLLDIEANVKPSYSADYGYKVQERGQQQPHGSKNGT